MINYDQYYKKGGDYVIPVEIFNDLLGEVEELHNKIDKAMNLVNNEIYKNRCECSYCNSYYLKEMKNILKDSDVDE